MQFLRLLLKLIEKRGENYEKENTYLFICIRIDDSSTHSGDERPVSAVWES